MNPTFDLLTQPWIPVIKNGEKLELSLKAVLHNAHNIDEISDPIPTVEFGLYRLLVALVMDIWKFEGYSGLEALLEGGEFDTERVDTYFENNKHCFDLFDSERPFLQSPDMDAFPDKPLSGLLPSVPSGTNATHFHHFDETDFSVSPAAAARLLTTIAPFMTAGGAGLAPSINGAPPWYVLVNGKKLFHTICLNCYAGESTGLGATGNAPPAWRNSAPPKCDGRSTKASLLEALTWRPRQIKLVPGDAGKCSVSGLNSPVLVRSMKFRAGASCDFTWTDPSVPYKITDKGPLAIRPQDGREIWRDTGPLMLLNDRIYKSPVGNIKFARPKLIEQFRQFVEQHRIDREAPLSINVYGMRTDMKMKVFEWQKEKLQVPVKMVMSSPIAQFAQESMDKAGSVEDALKKAIKHLARDDGKGNTRAFDTLIAYSIRQFWAAIRPYYNEMLQELADSQDKEECKWTIGEKWHLCVEKVALSVFDKNANGIDTYGDSIQRLVTARQKLKFGIYSAFETIEQKEARKNRKLKKIEGGKG